MDRPRRWISNTNRLMGAAILCATILATSGELEAGIVLLSGSSGYSNFQLDITTTTGAGVGPTFAGGELITPGSGFPALSGSIEGSTYAVSQSPISTNFVANYTNPAAFGTGTTDMLATLLGGNGASSARGGIFWLGDTTLADNLGGTTNQASVSVSIASASFMNTGTTSVNINNPGALLSVNGTLGGASSSYVAAGLTSSFSLSLNNASLGSTTLGSIALAANRNGGTVAFNGGGGGATSSNLSDGLLTATASSTNPTGSITLLPREIITFSATLTLISDPGSMITISPNLSPGFSNNPANLPDFGIIAGGPELAAAVPEPASIAMTGLGLVAAGLWSRSARRRRRLA